VNLPHWLEYWFPFVMSFACTSVGLWLGNRNGYRRGYAKGRSSGLFERRLLNIVAHGVPEPPPAKQETCPECRQPVPLIRGLLRCGNCGVSWDPAKPPSKGWVGF
jgi:hypothetical protein